EVGGALAHRDRLKFVIGDTIVHDPHEIWWLADLGLEHVAAIGALEQEKISAAHERTFRVEIDEARRRAPMEMQAAAVRRVDADDLSARGGGGDAEARIGAALGAMSMNDISGEGLGALQHVSDGENKAWPGG